MDVVDQKFVCGDCGNTTPVPNEVCTSCGGHMITLGAKPTKTEVKDDDTDDELTDEGTADGAGDEPAVESLEDLQAKEAEEDEPFFNTDDE